MKFLTIFLLPFILASCTYNVTHQTVPIKDCKFQDAHPMAHQGGVHTYVEYTCTVYVTTPTEDYRKENFQHLKTLEGQRFVN